MSTTHERQVTRLALAGGIPALTVALWLLWSGDHTSRVQWTLSVFMIIAWLAFAFSVRERVIRPLQTLSNMLAALQAFLAYAWPGNVRELAHAVERAALLAEGDKVRVSDLALRAPEGGGNRMEELSLEEVEKLLIQKAVARFQGNVTAAAKALGLSRSALYRRLQHHGL